MEKNYGTVHGLTEFSSSRRIERYAYWLRSTHDLDLMRTSYTYSDAYQREDLDGAVSFALPCLVQKLLAKNSLVLKCRHFDFFTPVTSFFTWPKNDLSQNCRSRPPICLQCRLPPVSSLLRFRYLRGRFSNPHPPSVQSWPRPRRCEG